MIVPARLQGGPFDGDTAGFECPNESVAPPPRVYVWMCRNCGGHTCWGDVPEPGTERYDRDEEDDKGVLIYVYTDLRLLDGARDARELVPAGAVPDTGVGGVVGALDR